MDLSRRHSASEPANPKLWAAIVLMAKSKFSTYPSPAAAHWVHKSYVEKGGQFVDPKRESPRDKQNRNDDKAGRERGHHGRGRRR